VVILQQAHSDNIMFTNPTNKGGTDFVWALVEKDPLKAWAFLLISLRTFF
jgi:hypothetical protein